MEFLKKNWGNLIFIVIIALLFIPQTAMPIKVFLSRLISFSPSEVKLENRIQLSSYQWELQTLDGVEVDLAHSEEKVVVINFWATWCPPCVAEMPALQNLYDQFGDTVEFYFVSSEEPDVLKRFLHKKGYTIPVFVEKQTPPKQLQSRTLPTTFIISKSGEIVIHETGAADWDSEEVVALMHDLIRI